MKKKLCLVLLVLSLLLTACAPGGQAGPKVPAPEASAPEVNIPAGTEPGTSVPEIKALLGVDLTDELSERERGWIEDLAYLKRGWEGFHPDPYFHCSEETFQWKLEQLAAQAGELSDSDLFFEIGSLVIALDEGRHTKAVPPDSLYDRVFPAVIQFLGDKAYLTRYAEGYEQFAPYLLREVVAVNGVDMAYLQRKFERFSSPNNVWYSKEQFYNYSALPAFYDWAGCGYKEGYTFQILNNDQEVVDVEVPALPLEECNVFAEDHTWVRPENWDRLAYMKGGNWAEYFEGENGGYVYVSFYEFEAALLEPLPMKATEVIAAHPECHKLVIDLRWNPGGDAALLKYFRDKGNMEALCAPNIKQTYVVVGGCSASASTSAASFFRGEMDAVIVGEPMGQFSSFYTLRTTKPSIRLPYSQIGIIVGNRWSGWDQKRSLLEEHCNAAFPSITEEYYNEDGYLYDWECMVLPDVYVSQDIEDIRQGKDSVIEWVLAQ